MKTDRPRLTYTDLRRRAEAYQHIVQARIDRLLRESGLAPSQLTRHANGHCYINGPLPSDPVRKAKVCLARQLANTRLYAAHAKIAVLVAKGRTDLNRTHASTATTTPDRTIPGVRRRPFTFTKEIST